MGWTCPGPPSKSRCDVHRTVDGSRAGVARSFGESRLAGVKPTRLSGGSRSLGTRADGMHRDQGPTSGENAVAGLVSVSLQRCQALRCALLNSVTPLTTL